MNWSDVGLFAALAVCAYGWVRFHVRGVRAGRRKPLWFHPPMGERDRRRMRGFHRKT